MFTEFKDNNKHLNEFIEDSKLLNEFQGIINK